MPAWAYYLLLASVFVGIAICALAFLITRGKIKRYQTEFIKNMPESEKASSQKAFESDKHLTILADEKAKAKNPLADEALLLAINTYVRNSYHSAVLLNLSDYEEKSMVELADATIAKATGKYDFVLIRANDETIGQIKGLYSNLKPNGMIIIADIKRRSKLGKDFAYEMKILNYRHEFDDLANGNILIAK